MAKNNIDDYEIKVREFGKVTFKAKGKPDKVKKETKEFFNTKF